MEILLIQFILMRINHDKHGSWKLYKSLSKHIYMYMIDNYQYQWYIYILSINYRWIFVNTSWIYTIINYHWILYQYLRYVINYYCIDIYGLYIYIYIEITNQNNKYWACLKTRHHHQNNFEPLDLGKSRECPPFVVSVVRLPLRANLPHSYLYLLIAQF